MDWNKKELSKHIMLDLLENGLLNEFDANSIEDLQNDVQDIIFERLKQFIIVSGRELE